MNRNESRNVIMTILYQIYMYQSNNIDYNLEEVINDNMEIDNNFVKEIVYGVLDKKNDIVSISNKYLKDWTFDRLGFTDRAILSIGIYELLYTNTPSVVAINEAIELSKKYSDDKVKNIVNGVLDKVYHEEK